MTISCTQFLLDSEPLPATRNSIDLLKISQDKLSALMTKLRGVNLMAKRIEMEDEGFVPVGLETAAAAAAAAAAGGPLAESKEEDRALKTPIQSTILIWLAVVDINAGVTLQRIP